MINPRPLFELLSTQEASVYIGILVEEGRELENSLLDFVAFLAFSLARFQAFACMMSKVGLLFRNTMLHHFFFSKKPNCNSYYSFG